MFWQRAGAAGMSMHCPFTDSAEAPTPTRTRPLAMPAMPVMIRDLGRPTPTTVVYPSLPRPSPLRHLHRLGDHRLPGQEPPDPLLTVLGLAALQVRLARHHCLHVGP